jgi:hypothetical protein
VAGNLDGAVHANGQRCRNRHRRLRRACRQETVKDSPCGPMHRTATAKRRKSCDNPVDHFYAPNYPLVFVSGLRRCCRLALVLLWSICQVWSPAAAMFSTLAYSPMQTAGQLIKSPQNWGFPAFQSLFSKCNFFEKVLLARYIAHPSPILRTSGQSLVFIGFQRGCPGLSLVRPSGFSRGIRPTMHEPPTGNDSTVKHPPLFVHPSTPKSAPHGALAPTASRTGGTPGLETAIDFYTQ